jgi:hypothetical protein
MSCAGTGRKESGDADLHC